MQGLKQLEENDAFTEDSNIVVIFTDHGSRYMSKIYSEDWMAEQGFFDASREVNKKVEYINDASAK